MVMRDCVKKLLNSVKLAAQNTENKHGKPSNESHAIVVRYYISTTQ